MAILAGSSNQRGALVSHPGDFIHFLITKTVNIWMDHVTLTEWKCLISLQQLSQLYQVGIKHFHALIMSIKLIDGVGLVQ